MLSLKMCTCQAWSLLCSEQNALCLFVILVTFVSRCLCMALRFRSTGSFSVVIDCCWLAVTVLSMWLNNFFFHHLCILPFGNRPPRRNRCEFGELSFPGSCAGSPRGIGLTVWDGSSLEDHEEIKSGFLKLGPLVVLDMILKKIQRSDCFESRCLSAIIAELGR